MKRALAIAIATVAVTVAAGGIARAQNYPWCGYYGSDDGENCGFSTYDQCMAAISGMNGACEHNTQYVPLAAPHSMRPRAHDRARRKRRPS